MNAPRLSAASAAVAGAALLGVSFMPWLTATSGEEVNMWRAFGFLDLVVAVATACALACGALALFGDSSGLPVVASSVTAGAGAVALLLLTFRLIDPPGSEGVEREVGLWLGPVAAAGILIGGYLGMQGGAPRSR